MRIFCNHDWKVLSETTTKSTIEKSRDLDLVANGPIRDWDLERKLIQVFSCKKCGKIKRYITQC